MGVIERQAAGGNDAMDMGMKPEFLTPGVQHGEEADFRAEVPRIASDFEKRSRTGAEQQIVNSPARKSEDGSNCSHARLYRVERMSPPPKTTIATPASIKSVSLSTDPYVSFSGVSSVAL